MKRIIILMVLLIAMTATQAQKIDAIVVNGIVNPFQMNEANFRTFSLDICPFKFGYAENLLGVYLQNDEFYAKNEEEIWTSRMTQFHIGLSFNSTFGYAENWHLQSRLGLGWTRTDVRADRRLYEDHQKDRSLMFSLNALHWREDLSWLSRHQLNFDLRQPFAAEKTAYWENSSIEVNNWNNQIFRAYFTETVFSTFIDRENDWKVNADLSFGASMEHRLLQNGNDENLVYPTLAAGVSFFKIPYFYQNMFEIGFEQHFAPMDRWMITAKLNLVPVFHWIWEKELITIGGQ